MILRDILAIVTSPGANEHVIAFAEKLAEQNSGRVTAALVQWMPQVPPIEGFVIGPMYADLITDARQRLAIDYERLQNRVRRNAPDAAVESHLIEFGNAGPQLGLRARHADVSIVARPDKDASQSAHAIFEAALMGSGRPVIIVPPSWKPGPIGRNILLAWKPTREAARAVGDADDLLTGADRVSVVTVDAEPSQGYGEQPGADITAHLAFRGAKPELFNLHSAGRSDARTVLDQALAVGADLIVLGGYGRARFSEIVFGGMTRDLLKTADVPVLMSH